MQMNDEQPLERVDGNSPDGTPVARTVALTTLCAMLEDQYLAIS